MTKKQLVLLSICNLVPWTVGTGLVPLLPVYASQFGVSSKGVGYYLALAYLALTAGTLLAGWLSDRFQRRKMLLVAAGLLMIPAIWMMGLATDIWQLSVFSAAVWFLGGVQITIVNIQIGLFSEKSKRGMAFGFLGMTPALGSLIGGLASGPLVDNQGYGTMFAVFAIFSVVLPLAAMYSTDKITKRKDRDQKLPAKRKVKPSPVIFLLVVSFTIVEIAVFISNMGRSMAMNKLGFLSVAISSTAAISGAVKLPFPLLLGWLSDRIGRKRIMVICYFMRSMALIVLIFSVSLWHFWIYAILISLGSISRSVGAAFLTDLVPPESLGLGMSLYKAGNFVGGIIGFACAGVLMQNLGMTTTLVMSSFLPIIAIAMLIRVRESVRDAR